MYCIACWGVFLLLIMLVAHSEVQGQTAISTKEQKVRRLKDGRVFIFDEAAQSWRLQSDETKNEAEKGSSQVQLALPWSQFNTSFEGEFSIDGTAVILGEDPTRRNQDQQAHGDTGNSIWDGAIALAKALERNPWLVKGREVLEVGAGRGLAGLGASILGARRTVLTDLAYCSEAMETALNLTKAGSSNLGPVEIAELDWGSAENYLHTQQGRHFDVVLAADVIWLMELVDLLVSGLHAIAKHSPNVEVLVVHQTRAASVEAAFLASMAKLGFVIAWELPGGAIKPRSGSAAESLDISWHEEFVPDHRIKLWCFRFRQQEQYRDET
eukprot:TRINITY_DN38725_c0_g1_i1.p1 TRINITY_DN38725_c0_g1~~TRINITY_DN38725_c0_g1_i1.p1  ORF type:complete len:326 (+),score=62.09 TRINITY_DN38725_c0_g1_i1:39-1016(+)